jgi:hypothetical protein
MRKIRKTALQVCLALAIFGALLYAADDLAARFRGQPTEQLKIDPVYADINRFNQVEYSAGIPYMATCVDALLPHFGYSPCWYLRRHTLQTIGP